MHLDLHAFPTRRSSDLVAGMIHETDRIKEIKAYSERTVGAALRGRPRFDQHSIHRRHSNRGRPRRAGPTVRSVMLNDLDRKSTRLNSSHPSISYAVFCL